MSARRTSPRSLKGPGFAVIGESPTAPTRGRADALIASVEALDESLVELGAVLRGRPEGVRTAPAVVAPTVVAPAPESLDRVEPALSFSRRFALRNVRRARALSLPMALGVALLCFALIRLPSANTAWTQEVTLNSAVGTGSFSCQPLKLVYNGASADGANTKYNYTLTGGGSNPITCKEIAWVSLAVCSTLNPALASAGAVLSETHPGLLNTVWSYTPQQPAPPTAGQVRWTSISASSGPFSAQFTFDLAGAPAPLSATHPQVLMTTPGAQPATLVDAVSVPCPPAPAISNSQPPAAKSLNAATPDTQGGYTGPIATPTPTNTPTPTPTPKSGGAQKPIGVAVFPPTPTPTPGHK